MANKYVSKSKVILETDVKKYIAYNQTILETSAAGDTTAPILTSPTSTETGSTTGSGTVTTDEANGTLYYYTSTSATPPSIANHKDGTSSVDFGNQVVSATGVQNITTTGLTASTLYYIHYLHTDAATNDSNQSTSASFTTDAPKVLIKYVSKSKVILETGIKKYVASNQTILETSALGDTTAPILTSPTSAKTGSTTGSGTVTTDEANGTLYYYTSTSITPPSIANHKDGTGSTDFGNQVVSATGVQNITTTGLTASTLYYIHYLHTDAATNDSNQSTSASFTTDAPKVLEAADSWFDGWWVDPTFRGLFFVPSAGYVEPPVVTIEQFDPTVIVNKPVTITINLTIDTE